MRPQSDGRAHLVVSNVGMGTSLHRRRALAWGVLAILVVACAGSVDALAPFPCANDHTCPGDLACMGSRCTPCAAPTLACSSACIDPTSDPDHCGGCGVVCPGGACFGGLCGCKPAPGGGTCTVAPQCGCTQGSKCARVGGAAEGCVAVGTGGDGASCKTDSDCIAPDTCASGLCTPTCTGSCAGSNSECLPVSLDGADLGYSACATHCNPEDPLHADGTHGACATGETCIGSNETMGATLCIPSTGARPSGSSCTGPGDCVPGDACVPALGGMYATCLPTCDVGSSQCSATETCVPLGVEHDGDIALGACQPASCSLVNPTAGSPFVRCQDGETCSPEALPYRCVSVVAAGNDGAPCTHADDCAAGLGCFLSSGLAAGTCTPWCVVGKPCAGRFGAASGYTCDGAGATEGGKSLGFCVASCNVLTPSLPVGNEVQCPVGNSCLAFAASGGTPAFTGCVALTAAFPVGGTCKSPAECAPGSDCVQASAGTNGTCHAWCIVGVSGCTAGTCMSFSPALQVGAEEYGVCE